MQDNNLQLDDSTSSVSPEEERLWSLLLRTYNNVNISFDDRFYLCTLLSQKINKKI